MNIGTIAVAVVLFAILAAIVVNLVRKAKAGQSISCSGCSGCGSKGGSHSCSHEDCSCSCTAFNLSIPEDPSVKEAKARS